jgi:hypothetical protein
MIIRNLSECKGLSARKAGNFIAICERMWSDFLAADPEVLGSIPGAARFSE